MLIRFGSEQLWVPGKKPKGRKMKKIRFFYKPQKPATHGRIGGNAWRRDGGIRIILLSG
jgi:hypothetical protein